MLGTDTSQRISDLNEIQPAITQSLGNMTDFSCGLYLNDEKSQQGGFRAGHEYKFVRFEVIRIRIRKVQRLFVFTFGFAVNTNNLPELYNKNSTR